MVADYEKRRHRYMGTNPWLRQVNEAVYYAPGWERWQIFRISLKGLSIGSKLVRLLEYWQDTEGHSDRDVEWVRIYNYLGALLRGGFEEARPMFNKMGDGDL